MEEAGITQYQFTAIIDNRTSQICSSMHGRTFSVEWGRQHMSDFLESEDVDVLKEKMPWRKDLSEFKLKPRQGVNDPKVSQALAEAGLSIPPLHGSLCRSVIEPI